MIKTSPALTRYDHGRILLIVPAAVIAGSVFPAVLDPKIMVKPVSDGP